MLNTFIEKRIRTLLKSKPLEAISRRNAAIGMTLENYLGISPNSRVQPDLNGIEFKSGIIGKNHFFKNPITIFTKTANWRHPIYSDKHLVSSLGRQGKHGYNFFCDVNQKLNSRNLKIQYDSNNMRLLEIHCCVTEEVISWWDANQLAERCILKLNQLIAVNADRLLINGTEHFDYKQAIYLASPQKENFIKCLMGGSINISHMIYTDVNQKLRNKGIAFRISFSDLSSIFAIKKTIAL